MNRIRTVFADHLPGQNPGDADYGIADTAVDPLGRPLRRTRQTGETVTFVYDLAGRLTAREYRTAANSPTGPIADQDVFAYEAASRVLTATKGRYANTVAYTYTEAGRVATESLTTSGQSYITSYAYDSEGQITALTYPDGSTATRAYADRGLLSSVAYDPDGNGPMAGTTIASFTYNAAGRETMRALGNGLSTTRTYLSDGAVDTIATPNVETLQYGYDENRNPVSESRTGAMAPYSWSTGAGGFDAVDRLVNWTTTSGDSEAWGLTGESDWLQYTQNGVIQNRTHTSAHELLTVDAASIVHDSRGNLTQDERGVTMTFDADNNASGFTENGASGLEDLTCEYDALGRRVATSSASAGTTIYVSAGHQTIAEYASGECKLVYGAFVDEPLVLIDAAGGTETLYYYHANRQYSIYALSDSAGAVVDRYAYTPYGAHVCCDADGTYRGAVPVAGNRVLYTGRVHDVETALCFYRARYYSPALGRFLSRDPSGFADGPNVYAYVHSNPYRQVDPDGHEGVDIDDIDFDANDRVVDSADVPWTRQEVQDAMQPIPACCPDKVIKGCCGKDRVLQHKRDNCFEITIWAKSVTYTNEAGVHSMLNGQSGFSIDGLPVIGFHGGGFMNDDIDMAGFGKHSIWECCCLSDDDVDSVKATMGMIGSSIMCNLPHSLQGETYPVGITNTLLRCATPLQAPYPTCHGQSASFSGGVGCPNLKPTIGQNSSTLVKGLRDNQYCRIKVLGEYFDKPFEPQPNQAAQP